MVRISSISCKVWWRSAAAWRREKEKLGVFLFVTLLILNLNEGLAHHRFSHSNSGIICRHL